MAIYLDHNATAPLREECLNIKPEWGNGSAVHGRGRRVRAVIESARRDIADCLGVSQRGLIFTSGATEANNTIIKTYKGPIIASKLEHASVLKACAHKAKLTVGEGAFEEKGGEGGFYEIPVLPSGIIDLNALENTLKHTPKALVSLIAAHNETGVIQPIEEACRLTHQYGGFFHTDAVQAFGRVTFDYSQFDYVTISSHKLGGFSGVGAMYVSDRAPLSALIHGGGQEFGLRSGTENILGIQSFAKAAKAAKEDSWANIQQHMRALANKLKQVPNTHLVVDEIINKVIGEVVDEETATLPNTLMIAFPGVPSSTLVMNLDLMGFEVSAGSACHSGKVRAGSVLEAMGVPEAMRNSVIRISAPYSATEADINAFFGAWQTLVQKLSQ